MHNNLWGKPRFRPFDEHTGKAVDDGLEYDWDIAIWEPGSKPLTRTGHTKPFGFVQTLCGRYRRLEDIDHSQYKYKGRSERQAINTPIQGSAADIVKGAMVRIEYSKELNFLGVEMVNQIHDELMMQVPEENAEAAAPIVAECMEHPFAAGKECLDVPIPVDLKIVDAWAHAK